MSLTGAAWVWQGLGIVQVERGWSGVISGAVLLGAGAIILALAAVLREIELLRESFAAAGLAQGLGQGLAHSPQQVPVSIPAAPPASSAPARAGVSLPRAAAPDLGFEPAAAREPGGAQIGGADHWKAILARTSPGRAAPAAPEAAQTSPPAQEAARESTQESAEDSAQEAREGRLARHYESQGVRYSLFDDGTIEAETDNGRYSFASLDELRVFLEARKAERGG